MDDVAVDRWLGSPVDDWRARWGLPRLRVYARVGSTNDIARRLADQGAPEGTTIIAEVQTRGRGRRGRSWASDSGASLLLSMVLRPETPGAETLLSLRLGIAAAQAIEDVTQASIGLKWPNDLFLQGRKVAGILCEAAGEPGRDFFLVAGIGINVSQRHEDWDPDIQATSLEASTGSPVPRDRLAQALVARWLEAARRQRPRLGPEELHELRRRDILVGQEILVDGRPAGVARGVAPDGALYAGDPASPTRIIAGTVRPRHMTLPETP